MIAFAGENHAVRRFVLNSAVASYADIGKITGNIIIKCRIQREIQFIAAGMTADAAAGMPQFRTARYFEIAMALVF